jgi:hypothetical protein
VWSETVVIPASEYDEGVSVPTVFPEVWLIYSDGPGPYVLHQCSRTTPLDEEGEADLKILREFVKNPPKWPLAPSPPSRP